MGCKLLMFFRNKNTLQQTYDYINKLNLKELHQMIDDFFDDCVTSYAVLAIDTPNKKIPFFKRKYGCVTYSDAAELYNKVVNRYNSLL